MSEPELHIVTGAFGYSGQYIARRLLAAGHRVRTLTSSPDRENAFGGRVESAPYSFDAQDRLAASLVGARVLYNTYWVRFNHRDFKHADAVANTLALFEAALEAGVPRIVHVSITNPSLQSDLEYFSGKARLEEALRASKISHAILRPTVLFGDEDILVNNIAWMLRKFPVFGVFGDGQYMLQPIHVDDLALLAIEQGQRDASVVIDAIGPETYTYRDLVALIGDAIGCPRPIIGIPPFLGLLAGKVVGWLMDDVLITPEEIVGLMRGLLCTSSPPAGQTRLSAWVREHAADLGRRYSSELARRRDRKTSYSALRGR